MFGVEAWGKPAAIVVVAVVLFFINGIEAAKGFLEHDMAVEVLGSLGTVLVVVLGFMVRPTPQGERKAS